MSRSIPTLFGADFADYPIMQEMLLGLADDLPVRVGGRSGLADRGDVADLLDDSYFDWPGYQRPAPTGEAGLIVDPDAETFYAGAQRQFQRALDRVFLEPLPAREAERYFWDLVARLETRFAPERDELIVLFAHTPHFPWHIVFFHVCRRLGITRYVFKRTQTPDGMFLDTGLLCDPGCIERAAQPVEAEPLIESLDEVSGRLERSREINRKAERVAFKPMGWGLGLRLLRRFFKQRDEYRRRHYFRLPWWRLFVLSLQRDRERRADLAHLDRLACRTAPDAPYVYFALHYQPERTTVPEADFYHDQLRAITALSRALPSGWVLAVKEHPRQLGDRRPDLRCLHYRRTELYDGIAALDNAVLVHAFTPSESLIAGARLTASCNGSSVFEGLQHGIAGLTFVSTWHSACESAPAIESLDTLPALVARLAAKSADRVRQDVTTFLHENSRFWFVGANDDRAAELSRRTRDTLIQSMQHEVQALAARFQSEGRFSGVS